MCLDEDHPKTEYHLGRLLCVLDNLQRAAVNPNKGLADSYFRSARTTPNKIYPSILDKATHHLEKLGKNKGGLKVWHEKKIQDILGRVSEFPKKIKRADEGYFLLGYYHQKQDLFQKKSESESSEEHNNE